MNALPVNTEEELLERGVLRFRIPRTASDTWRIRGVVGDVSPESADPHTRSG